MGRNAAAIAAVLFTLGVSGPAAQGRPDFSGTWTLVEAESSNAAGIAFLGMAFTAEQTDETLTVTPTLHQIHRGERPEELRAVYRLDGSQDTNLAHSPNHGGVPPVRVSTVKWDAGRMVLTFAVDTNGYTGSTHVQRWSLNPSGNLIVEATVTARGEIRTHKATYRKPVTAG